jgi:hypothetical protein
VQHALNLSQDHGARASEPRRVPAQGFRRAARSMRRPHRRRRSWAQSSGLTETAPSQARRPSSSADRTRTVAAVASPRTRTSSPALSLWRPGAVTTTSIEFAPACVNSGSALTTRRRKDSRPLFGTRRRTKHTRWAQAGLQPGSAPHERFVLRRAGWRSRARPCRWSTWVYVFAVTARSR